MTLNQSALLELTEAMRTADDGKVMRKDDEPGRFAGRCTGRTDHGVGFCQRDLYLGGAGRSEATRHQAAMPASYLASPCDLDLPQRSAPTRDNPN